VSISARIASRLRPFGVSWARITRRRSSRSYRFLAVVGAQCVWQESAASPPVERGSGHPTSLAASAAVRRRCGAAASGATTSVKPIERLAESASKQRDAACLVAQKIHVPREVVPVLLAVAQPNASNSDSIRPSSRDLTRVAPFHAIRASRSEADSARCRDVTETLGSIGEGVSLVARAKVYFTTTSPDRLRPLQPLDRRGTSAPAFDAVRSGQSVFVSRISEQAGRWPAFGAAAGALGIGTAAFAPTGAARLSALWRSVTVASATGQ
jgi:hypothetical protein